MKKLLVTGSSGMLGSNVVSEIGGKYEIFGIYKNHSNPMLKNQFKVDITDFEKVKEIINSISPDFIIHSAALTNVDACEKDPELARSTNALATRNLASLSKPETKFIYISTESVFDGKKGNYGEKDPPHPLNNYARTKLEGEKFVENLIDNFAIIRTTIFGWNHVKRDQSFAEWIYRSLCAKKPIEMFTDVIFSPITVNTLALLIDRLLNIDFTGKLHIGTRDSISKYNFGIYLAELFGFSAAGIKPVSVDSFAFKARRPKNVSLDITKADSIFGSLPTAEDELAKFYNINRMQK